MVTPLRGRDELDLVLDRLDPHGLALGAGDQLGGDLRGEACGDRLVEGGGRRASPEDGLADLGFAERDGLAVAFYDDK